MSPTLRSAPIAGVTYTVIAAATGTSFGGDSGVGLVLLVGTAVVAATSLTSLTSLISRSKATRNP